jgi:ABC-type antimicrobial peptide transport system permease subunit
MYLLFGAVALLLAIGSGNVSFLLLARGTAYQQELAVRSAVGASGFRIVRQLLTESMLLSVTGAGLGILLAYRTIGLIIPRLSEYCYAAFSLGFFQTVELWARGRTRSLQRLSIPVLGSWRIFHVLCKEVVDHGIWNHDRRSRPTRRYNLNTEY